MQDFLGELRTAAEKGAAEVEARVSDGSFLESTLEEAIANNLPGVASRAEQRRRLPLEGYEPPPYGVDIVWTFAGASLAIETKVTDVLDTLFDVVKVATAVAHGHFAAGFCAVAATAPQWSRGGPVRAMVEAPIGIWSEWQTDDLLVGPAADAVLVPGGPRPRKVPARLATMAAPPVEMRRAATHVLQVFGVTATPAEMISLPG